MPRKSRHCVANRELMVTRSSSRASQSVAPATRCKPKLITPKPSEAMPDLAALIVAASQIDYPASVTKRINTKVAAKVKNLLAPIVASSLKETRPKRRKREAIQLPPGLAAAKLSVKEVKRLKNRIAANRLRKRSQQDVRSLQEQLEDYKARCEFLEIVVAGCSTCASLGAVHFGEMELIPVETNAIKTKKDQPLHDLERDDDDAALPVLTEAECILLDNVLRC